LGLRNSTVVTGVLGLRNSTVVTGVLGLRNSTVVTGVFFAQSMYLPIISKMKAPVGQFVYNNVCNNFFSYTAPLMGQSQEKVCEIMIWNVSFGLSYKVRQPFYNY
jgi:hypothetical protein